MLEFDTTTIIENSILKTRIIGKPTREQELAVNIADYLTDWVEDDDESVRDFDDSVETIESYGVTFNSPCDELVTNAIRHFKYVVNPMNSATIPDTMMELFGMTEDECRKYWCNEYLLDWRL